MQRCFQNSKSPLAKHLFSRTWSERRDGRGEEPLPTTKLHPQPFWTRTREKKGMAHDAVQTKPKSTWPKVKLVHWVQPTGPILTKGYCGIPFYPISIFIPCLSRELFLISISCLIRIVIMLVSSFNLVFSHVQESLGVQVREGTILLLYIQMSPHSNCLCLLLSINSQSFS